MQLASKDGELKVREHELSEARQEVAEKDAAMENAEAAWRVESTALGTARDDAQRDRLETCDRLSNMEQELHQAQVCCVVLPTTVCVI